MKLNNSFSYKNYFSNTSTVNAYSSTIPLNDETNKTTVTLKNYLKRDPKINNYTSVNQTLPH